MISFLRAHKRAITFSLVAFCAFLLTPSWGEVGLFYFLLFFVILVMLIASQLFWIRRVLDLAERFIPGKPRRAWLAVIAGVAICFSSLTASQGLESVIYPARPTRGCTAF